MLGTACQTACIAVDGFPYDKYTFQRNVWSQSNSDSYAHDECVWLCYNANTSITLATKSNDLDASHTLDPIEQILQCRIVDLQSLMQSAKINLLVFKKNNMPLSHWFFIVGQMCLLCNAAIDTDLSTLP